MNKSFVRVMAALATMGAASMGLASAGHAASFRLHALNEGPKSPTPAESAAGTFSLPSSLVERVEDVPLSELIAQALRAHKPAGSAQQVRAPEKLTAKNPSLVSNGKPEIIFVGGEFCPYCATERWSIVMALYKFGTFSHLVGTTSSSTDVDPRSPTFSFYGSHYSSAELVFLGDELFNNHGASATGYPVLQAPSKLESALITKYDGPPYVPADEAGGIPFVYLAGRFLLVGPQWLGPQLAGLSWARASVMLTSGTSHISKEAEAAAGFLLGDICAITHAKPASVCSRVPPILLGVHT